MTDEVQTNLGEGVAVEAQEQETQTPEISPAEQRARAAGWRPKEEFTGDPEDWYDYKEFNRRGELFERIKSQSHELKEVRQALEDIKKHNETIRETAYKQALAAVKSQKAEALEIGDKSAFLQAENAEEQLREQWTAERQKAAANQEKSEPSLVFQEFLAYNPWYIEDTQKRVYADQVGYDYAVANGIDLKTATKAQQVAVLQHVARKVATEFSKQKETHSKVTSAPAGTATNKANAQTPNLTPEQKRVMEKFVKLGVMTKEQYLKDIQAKG